MPGWMRRILERSSKARVDQSESPSGDVKVPSIRPGTVYTPITLSFPQLTSSNTPAFSFTREFPFDIITEILSHASQVILNDMEPRFIVSPILLSRVCKSWRSYLHVTPSFWSSIIISLSQAKRSQHLYIAGLKVWLRRAGDLPLDIYVDGDAKRLESAVLRHQVCQFLANCRSRWRSIDICSVDHEFARLFERTYKPSGGSTIPLLQSYVIRAQHRSNPPFLTDLQYVPALETLQIIGYGSDHITRWRFDPQLIRNITLTTTQKIATYTILSSYPLLQTADIQYPFHYSTYHLYDRKVIRHDHIRSLKITTKTSSYITDSLLRLQAPKLEDLQLYSREVLNGEWFDVVSSIDDFVERSGCHLVRLSLQINLLQESLFIHMSCFLPSLEELNVHHVETFQSYQTFGGLTRAFFRKLHPDANNSILPNLRILIYEGPLGIETLDPLEALVLRLLPRQHSLTSGPVRVPYQPHSTIKLNFAKIVAEQNGRHLSRDFAKSELLEQIGLLVDSNALWLLNANGSRWE